MQEKLTIAMIQADLVWEDPKANREYFEQKIEGLESPVDLIVLPEMFSTGFSMNPHELAEAETGPTLSWMKATAKKRGTAIAGSLMVKEEGSFYNRFYFVTADGAIEHYDKRDTFRLAGEDKVYNSGGEQKLVTFKGWKLFLQVCYDLRFPVFSRNTMNYDALIYVANWPKVRVFAWETLLKARAIENMAYCIGVNRMGLDGNNYEYSGQTAVYDALGATVVHAGAAESVVIAKLEKAHLQQTRTKLNFLEDRDRFHLELQG